MKTTFEDGVWAVIENFHGYDFGVREIIKEFKITKEQAIQFSKKTGFRPEIIQEIDDMDWFQTTSQTSCSEGTK